MRRPAAEDLDCAMRPADPRVVELLNDALTFELTVTNTYFLHARMLDNWGFPRLGKVFYDLSIDEMRDADALINRVLFFEGHPNVQRLGAIRVGETPRRCSASPWRARWPPSRSSTPRPGVPRPRRPRHRGGLRGDGPRRGEARRLVRGSSRRSMRVGLPQYLAQQIEDQRTLSRGAAGAGRARPRAQPGPGRSSPAGSARWASIACWSSPAWAPSTIRWSAVATRTHVGRATTSPSTTTGRSRTAPTAR